MQTERPLLQIYEIYGRGGTGPFPRFWYRVGRFPFALRCSVSQRFTRSPADEP